MRSTTRSLSLAGATLALLAVAACGRNEDVSDAVTRGDTAGVTAVPSGTAAGDSARAGFGGRMEGTTLMGDSIGPRRDTVTPARQP